MNGIRKHVVVDILSAICGFSSHRRLNILMYHRVLAEPDELLPEEPTAEVFDQLLEWMAGYLVILPLPEAVQRLQSGTLPLRAACVTFDDGYRNNHEVALPLLKRRGVPATFFIATGIGEYNAMWNDLVIEAFRQCQDSIDLREFELGLYRFSSSHERLDKMGLVLQLLKYRPHAERARIAKQIYDTYCGSTPPNLMMSSQMVRELAEEGHDVGAHTISHPILAGLDTAAARDEIFGSRDALARILGASPSTFAYPNGRPGIDFDNRHCEIVREAGFSCAVSTAWGSATPGSNFMALPRFTPWERTKTGFLTRIAKTYVQSYLHSNSNKNKVNINSN